MACTAASHPRVRADEHADGGEQAAPAPEAETTLVVEAELLGVDGVAEAETLGEMGNDTLDPAADVQKPAAGDMGKEGEGSTSANGLGGGKAGSCIGAQSVPELARAKTSKSMIKICPHDGPTLLACIAAAVARRAKNKK